MLFNSIDFAIFLPVAFILYWLIDRYNHPFQNVYLVLISYFFYGCWDWRFLGLIFLSTVVDFFVGLSLSKYEHSGLRKLFLGISITVNLGILAFFKYFNFFLDNISMVFSFWGTNLELTSLDIVLPVGISFYTFQTMSYTIDNYLRKIKASDDFVAFAAFVCYFPQLVAGPIERASNLLPQFNKKRNFDYDEAINGMRQVLWGLFKKVVIADNCAEVANQVFNNSSDYSGSTLLIGAIFYSFQIYGDFSGYSDMAIGTSKLFGIKLMKNFSFPYFSRDVGEFWRRWHISLSTWFRDYLYIPLGGSKGGISLKLRNTFIIFIVCGFWHGANWTFIVWGLLNAIYFIPLLLLNKNRKYIEIIAKGKYLPALGDIIKVLVTFSLITISWVFFRAENLTHAISYLSEMFSISIFHYPDEGIVSMGRTTMVLMFIFIIMEWIGREGEFAFEWIGKDRPYYIRFPMYYGMTLMIMWFSGKEQEFIYFQF